MVVLLTISLTLNAVFAALMIWGYLQDRKIAKATQRIIQGINKATEKQMTNRYHA